MLSLCRLCASLRKRDLLIVIKDDSNEICDKLRECCQINIKMKDPLPKSICQECMEHLNNSHNFYIKVKEAQETLQTLYPSADVNEENEKEFETNSVVETTKAVQENVKQLKISIIAQSKVVIPNVQNEIVSKKQIQLEKSDDSKKLSSEKTLESYIDQIYEELEMTNQGVKETIQESQMGDLTMDSDNDEMGNGQEELVNEQDVRDNNENPIDGVLIESNEDVIVNDKNLNDELEYVNIYEQLETIQDSQIEDLTLDSDIEEQVFNDEKGNGQDELLNEEDLRDNNENPFDGVLMESNEYNEDVIVKDKNDNEDVIVNDNNDELEYVNIYEEVEGDEDAMEVAEIDSGVKQNEHITTLNSQFRLKSWKNYNYICFICDFQGTDFIKLKNHIIQNHNITEIDNFKYKCYDCQKSISRYNLFLNHVRSKHHPDLKLKCEVCDLNCENFEELSHHRSVNCVEAHNYGSIVSCNQCYESFHNIDDLQNHQKFIHDNDKVKSLLHEETNRFNCSFCGSTFSRKSSLEQHMFIHLEDKLYKCKICNKSFKSFLDLDQHQIVHSDVKLYKCDFCVKSFLTKIEKITHERTHTGEMPFACNICDKRFRIYHTLKSHVRRHTVVKKYSCEYCEKIFSDSSNRNKHVKRKHANEVKK